MNAGRPSESSMDDGDRGPISTISEQPKPDPNKPIAWRDLPKKKQLAVITLARMSEPLTQTSLQAYLFFQLKWFDPSLPDSTISSQAGILHASFMAAQFATAMLWGRVADSPRAGRKTVLLIGLFGTCLSSLGFGFSTSFWQALFFRTLGGATNGNIGVMRTMISEIIQEKKYQSRAFLLLPMTFNIGVIVGPILGGLLSDPAGSYPNVFGEVDFLRKYPYAPPNILCAAFLCLAGLAVWFCLEETLDSLLDRPPDLGQRTGRKLWSLYQKLRHGDKSQGYYTTVPSGDIELTEEPVSPKKRLGPRFTQRLAFGRIFTPNVSLVLLTHFLLAGHVGTFNSLWFVFLSTPVWDPKESDDERELPLRFTGGVGLQPQSIGFAMAILGVIGITMQLFLYMRVAARLGTLKSWRLSLLCFPIAYMLVPYLSVVPSTSPPPAPKTGPTLWLALFGILFIQVTGRTFALPGQTILVNNASPHPSVLGTVHGLGQSASSAARTISPMVAGFVYGAGLNNNMVALVWWCLSGVAVCAIVVSWKIKEGDGHEIWLEGDAEEDDE